MHLFDTLSSSSVSSLRGLHTWAGSDFESAGWDVVASDAHAMTAGLRAAGVRPGVTVAAVLTNSPDVVRGLLGVWLAGGAVASLPVPARGMAPVEYSRQLTAICDQLDPPLMLIEQRMLELLPPELRARTRARSFESFAGSGRIEATPPEIDEIAFVQYSSGSTSQPKGCMLTPRAIAAQIELIWAMIDGQPKEDAAASWLPLSHDMGLFGLLLTPWAFDCDLYLSTPERFMMAPRTWFGDLAEHDLTVTAGTNTALHVAARTHRTMPLRGRLKLRVCIVGAERISWDTLTLASDTLAPYGFQPQALMPAYGLAEATLAVTATPVHEAARHVVLDAGALADFELVEADPDAPTATRIVAAGVPCEGVTLSGLRSDRLGEIQVQSPSLANGYLADPERTRERFRDSGFLTGDLAFIRDGYLYPVARADDAISVGGRKVYACEIESAVDVLTGMRRGCSTLVERNGTGGLALMVEMSDTDGDYRHLAAQAADAAMARAAVPLSECIFLPKGSLPKTPSGKIQRHRCRRLLDTGDYEQLATIEFAGSSR